MISTRNSLLAPLYRSAVRQFDQRAQAIRLEQWSLSTPDDGWNVHRLVRHVITGQLALPGFLGADAAPAQQRLADSATPEEVLAAWTAASTAASNAVGAIDSPDRQLIGWRLATELTVHGWDLARAIGAPDEFPNDLLAHVLDEAKTNAAQWFPADRYRAPIPVPGCTDDLTELLALTGRNRWWRRQS